MYGLALTPLALAARRAGPAASLDLNFISGGAFDSRIAFSRPSGATRINSAGLLEMVASGAPRIDYDPITLAVRGLLVEEQRANLLQRSGNLADNSAWAAFTLTRTANADTAPDGTLSATRLDIQGGGVSSVYQSVAVSAGAAYTFSLYVKLGTLAAADYKVAFYDETAGAFISSDVVPSTAPTTTGYRRCTWTVTAPAGCVSMRAYAFRNSDTTKTGSVFVWGSQFEAGAFATSYIPTTTAQATRAGDVATMALGSWFNAAEGAIVAEYDCLTNSTAAGNRIASLYGSPGNVTNEILLFVSVAGKQGSLNVFTGGVNAGRIDSATTLTPGAVIKAAGAFKPGDRAVTANGEVPATSAAAFSMPTLTTLGIGCNDVGTQINGHIRRLRIYRTRLSNAQLQGLTA